MSHSTGRSVALVASIAILSWASAYPVVRIALRDMPPIPLAALRYAIAAVLALAWLAWTRPTPPRLSDIPQFLASGAIGITLYNILFNQGEVTVSSGAASLLISAAPLMAGVLATIFLGERMPAWGWIGSLLSFAGVAMIAQGQAGGLALGSGASLVFGAAVCGAVYTVLQKGLVRRYGALPTIAYILIVGAVLLAPWLPEALSDYTRASWTSRFSVMELGIFPAAIGYAAWGAVIGRLGAARGAIFLYLLPPVTMVLAFGLTGEVPTPRTLLGGAIVMAGVIMTNTLGRSSRVRTA